MNAPELGPGALSEEERDDLVRAILRPDDDCAHNFAPLFAAVERILADRAARPADEGLRERVRSADAAWAQAVGRLSAARQVYERMVFDPTANHFDKRVWMQHLADLRAALDGDELKPAPSAPEEEADE